VTIDIAILISGISAAFAIFFGLMGRKRTEKADTKADATEITTVRVNLENIMKGVDEIKGELSHMKEDMILVREKATVALETATSTRKRLDDHILKGEKE
jgi:hypothetical protein